MDTLEQEIIIQRDTGTRSAPEMYAVQLEDIADAIREYSTDVGAEEVDDTLREDAETIRDTDSLDWQEEAEDAYRTAEDMLTELTGLYAVTIPESGTWFIVTPAGLEQLSEEN